ncbi:hypothetical protein [Acidicapsa acidisoli]|uniref:hypothetical protein n=1 Tax=Acidicapsa acidisoli TaxID=1615681 RepID=UPI0021E09D28|nr:hypothetical protein [Acidicapsa acidisoli]
MQTSACLVLAASLALIPATKLVCQDESGISHAPDGGISRHVEGISVLSIPGAPFTTKEVVRLTNHLQDGTLIEQHYYAMIVRDSEGKVYRETRDRIPMGSNREPPLRNFYFSDPKNARRITCTPATKTCVVTSWRPNLHVTEEPVGLSKDGLSYLTRESMGHSTIDSLEAIDTRETRTYNAGAFGNDRPVAVTKRYWYAPQLQINLAVDRHDPRTEDQKLELTELNLSEPDPAWFIVPDGYRIIRDRAPTAFQR